MNKVLGLSVALAFAPAAHAADIEAGKAKVATVCAACHGANGVSVSDTIPNLAGQRAYPPAESFSSTGVRKPSSTLRPTAPLPRGSGGLDMAPASSKVHSWSKLSAVIRLSFGTSYYDA